MAAAGFAVRTWGQSDAAYVAVGDRGKGLAPDEMEKLKAPFSAAAAARHPAAQDSGWPSSNVLRGCTAARLSFMRVKAAGSRR